MRELEIAIIGALVGSLSTLLWEAFIRPRREARSLAEVLAADVSLHAQAVASDLVQIEANAKTIPSAHPVPVALFSAVVGRIGELPRDLVGETLALYRHLARLNEISERANAIYARLNILASDDPNYELLKKQLAENVALYNRFVDNAKKRINHVQPRLIAAAMPWWSPRFWRGPKPTSINKEDMSKLVSQMRSDQSERMDKLL